MDLGDWNPYSWFIEIPMLPDKPFDLYITIYCKIKNYHYGYKHPLKMTAHQEVSRYPPPG